MLMTLECFSSGIRGWWLSGTVGGGAQWAGPNGCSVLPAAPPEAQCKPYYSDYSRFRLLVHHLCTSHYLDLFITGVIGLNVVTMAMEHYQQPQVGLSDWPSGPHLIMSLGVKLAQPEAGRLRPVLGPYRGPSCTTCRDLQRSVLSWSDR